MKPRKHADLIKAWADGATIERVWHDYKSKTSSWLIDKEPDWSEFEEYRIKPEPRADIVEVAYVTRRIDGEVYVCQGFHEIPNVKFTWDGETGRLKKTEVLE